MITRIVKLTFKPESVQGFKEIFYASQKQILAFEGCIRVDLMNDINNECTFFTLSYWTSEEDLDNYRYSYLFINTWSKVKPLFSEKAEAWSLSLNQNKSI
ncbi:MAG: antibiotic biosynthesis monooxygenase family protein [Daejeonella sp.]|uniref:putative quinol monooxygenase n=1 Tax=Daejeonella sp. TaxID=2805397 RepID=UPI00273711C3|nr:antibiotic biosynthesis monooxygenase family protein [Daejeonella sp.]MDP3468242.1 antibiotic biosynthesis monooxygenase family protein [Daejeonella sp.]